MTAALDIPELATERLRLRAPRAGDFAAHGETLRSERARFVGGPFSLRDAWRDFAADASSWVLYGYGPFVVEPREGGAFLGLIILHFPAYYPEREIGWVMHERAEGGGVAAEAAAAVLRFAADRCGWSTLVSYIDPENRRSIALAERLGARRDAAAALPEGQTAEICLVYRHDLARWRADAARDAEAAA